MRYGLKSLCSVATAAILFATLSGCPGPKKKTSVSVGETAVVVRNIDADLATRFSFARTIGQILTTAGIEDNATNRETLVRSMVLSFNSNQFTNLQSGLAMAIAPRPGDAAISAADLLNPASANGLKPIGLFNRLDLAPADWSDCGEHRIVYAGGNKIFVIFEAKLPNPNPSAGKQGCRAVAQRWADVSTAPAVPQRNKLLDEFYYGSLPGGFRSVVHFLNYGSFLGQVRTNILGQGPWQLREFRVLPVAAGQLAFAPGPDASNPLSSFYKDNPLGSPLEQSERTHFQAQFAAAYLNNLRSIDAGEPAATTDADFRIKLMNGLGAGFEFRSDEFQSASQIGNEIPTQAFAGTAMKALIPLNWTAPGGRAVDQAQMLNRAGAVTCGGCHGLSSNKPIGTFNGATITWPNVAPSGFVHIGMDTDSSGNHVISEALAKFFIPFREKVTDDVLNTTTAMVAPRNGSETRLASLFLFQGQTQAPPPPNANGAPSREQAENAALNLASSQPRGFAPEDVGRAAAAVRRTSELAHAADQAAPGAYVTFRRPH
ncbi:MAG TPA: hypothetical protein VKC17_01705 [Sphingomicrobium sp.]|nr:hypothetical protein [Sphingomicrobium sp.]